MSGHQTNPANPEDPIRVGTRVRSLDFPLPLMPERTELAETYVEGAVIGFEQYEGCWRYRIDVDRRVIEGKEVPVSRPWIVIPPVNGTPIFGSDNLTSGVSIIDAPPSKGKP